MESVNYGVAEAADPQDCEGGAGQFYPAFLPGIKRKVSSAKPLGQLAGDDKADECNQEFLARMVFEQKFLFR